MIKDLDTCVEYLSMIRADVQLSEFHKEGRYLEYKEKQMYKQCRPCLRGVNANCPNYLPVRDYLDMVKK